MASITEDSTESVYNAYKLSAAEQNKTPLKNEQIDSRYAESNPRVSKDDMFMIVALWMEDFPVVKDPTAIFVVEDQCLKVGAVLVLPNDIVWAADCSRDGVHAVARLLMKHHDKAKGCKMFMSRKPCRICAKLLVQSKVKRVLYLPREPEYYQDPETETDTEDDQGTPREPEHPEPVIEINTDEDPAEAAKSSDKPESPNVIQMKQVDIMFTVSPIAQTKFVLQVEESVLQKARKETPTKDEDEALALKDKLIEDYHFDAWLNDIKKKLPWPAFDEKMKKKVQQRFAGVMEWIARVLLSGGNKARGRNFKFKLIRQESKLVPANLTALKEDSTHAEQAKHGPPSNVSFNPAENTTHAEQAKHIIEMARFLAQRTDDPKTGVGAVIVSYPGMEIISIGWNGFPLKAHYGDFARASHDDDDTEDHKFPYVIHAEQNALMMRNDKNIKDAILFVTKSPCDECAPLIAMEGIKTVVVDQDVKYRPEKKPKKNEYMLGYNVFFEMVKADKFICYQTEKYETTNAPDAIMQRPEGSFKRNLVTELGEHEGKEPKIPKI